MKNDIQPRAIALDSYGTYTSKILDMFPNGKPSWCTKRSMYNVYCGVLLIAKMYLQHWIAQNKAMTCELYKVF